jgi:hypothetical protein
LGDVPSLTIALGVGAILMLLTKGSMVFDLASYSWCLSWGIEKDTKVQIGSPSSKYSNNKW